MENENKTMTDEKVKEMLKSAGFGFDDEPKVKEARELAKPEERKNAGTYPEYPTVEAFCYFLGWMLVVGGGIFAILLWIADGYNNHFEYIGIGVAITTAIVSVALFASAAKIRLLAEIKAELKELNKKKDEQSK